ncbi:MAG: hypothetical protein ACRDH8_09570 [Actinomycetota bacterium]
MRRWVIGVVAGAFLVTAGIASAAFSRSVDRAPLSGPPESVPPPGIPETVPPEEAEAADGVPAPAQAGMATAEANRARARAFVEAMQAWTGCVGEQAPLHDESTGEFDPQAACGPKPRPPHAGDGEPDGAARPPGNPGGPGDEGRGQEASAFGQQTAEEAQAGGEAFGETISEEAESGGEAFGQQTAEEAKPGLAGGP